jgi:hydrogenase maturation protein HypF
MTNKTGARIHITGIVQGVGFRPFVYGLATELDLTGWVRNTSAGVDIEVDGEKPDLERFIQALEQDAPPLALIDSLEAAFVPPNGFSSFEIVHSEPIPGAFQPISPDVSICDDCLEELFDPGDHRYLYPFINCTNCGPRLTIIKDIPYDRPKTTMAPFEMCPTCRAEYEDPHDRRFHAQPVACPVCGPHVWLERSDDPKPISQRGDAIEATRQLLTDGEIVAIKGLGGFHLACDANNPDAVAELRQRKLRVEKPFAVMMPDLATVEQHCFLNEVERELLTSRQRPIVLLWQRAESDIAEEVAPNQKTLGVMLPYTPLHYLLFSEADYATLVMTSGNLSEEPIAYTNADARERLGDLADAFLMHNRDIHVRCDDSVARVRETVSKESGQAYPVRRSRGYAPYPVLLPEKTFPLLATGAELKNTFCLTKDRYAFLSHHIGDMENYETLRSFEEGVEHYERLFRVQPELIACDMHPNYMATRYALQRGEEENIPVVKVQHHHAHIASCMAEHGLSGNEPVIGVSLDGTGYGDDGAIWGGEFLLADYRGYHRYAHLSYTPLPGGDRAIKEPWRMALSWLHTAGIAWDEDLPPLQYAASRARRDSKIHESPIDILRHQLHSGINAPPTSSMGRLFDAVSALVGIRPTVNYEAQAAIELEALVDPDEQGAYPLILEENQTINPAPMFKQIIADLRAGTRPAIIAARFHRGLAAVILEACLAMRKEYQINQVALSGGVWQNMTLLHRANALLQEEGFEVLIHEKVPANDGGIALGQAAVAAYQST